MGNIEKMASVAQNAIGNLMPMTSKVQEGVQQITEDVLTKGSKLEKVLADYETAQGKAVVGLQASAEDAKIAAAKQAEAKKIVADGLVGARAVVKKAPLPSKAKKEVLSGINAEIENRHLSANLANKSAEESCGVIEALSPIDEEVKKHDLIVKHGDKLEQLHAKKAGFKKYMIATRIMMDAVYAVTRKAYDDSELIARKNTGSLKRITELKDYKETSLEEYLANYLKTIKARYTDKGLAVLRDELKAAKFPDDQKTLQECLVQDINAELELRMVVTPPTGLAYEDVAAPLADEKLFRERHLDEHLAELKEELMEKHKEVFEARPGRRAAKTIQELSPVDLGAKKIELMEKHGDVITIKYLMSKYGLNYEDAREYIDMEAYRLGSFLGLKKEDALKVLAAKARKPYKYYDELVAETLQK